MQLIGFTNKSNLFLRNFKMPQVETAQKPPIKF